MYVIHNPRRILYIYHTLYNLTCASVVFTCFISFDDLKIGYIRKYLDIVCSTLPRSNYLCYGRETGTRQKRDWDRAKERLGPGKRETGTGQKRDWDQAKERLGPGKRETGTGQKRDWDQAKERLGPGKRETGT